MFDLRNSVLLTFTLLTHFLPAAQAAVSLHYFPQASCNANTDISGYTSVAAALLDTSCHLAPDGTVALYVDGVDEGCTGIQPLPEHYINADSFSPHLQRRDLRLSHGSLNHSRDLLL